MAGMTATGPANPAWAGNAVTYKGLHVRLRRTNGRASEHLCTCGRQAEHWSYDGRDPDEHDSVFGPFSLNLDRYQPLCVRCHRALDRSPGFIPPLTKLNDREAKEVRELWATGELSRSVTWPTSSACRWPPSPESCWARRGLTWVAHGSAPGGLAPDAPTFERPRKGIQPERVPRQTMFEVPAGHQIGQSVRMQPIALGTVAGIGRP
jgi:hypothetical protein